jgi:N-acetylglucosamine kinase-like BadF-type ATPase
MRYVLGIDGGGSRIACLVADEKGTILGHGRGGPVNTMYVTPQEAIESLKAAITASIQQAGVRGDDIETLCLSAPMDPECVDQVLETCGIRRLVRAAEGETARWAASFWITGRIGVTVDAGTGSVARGRARDGRETGAGGWGAVFGDEGSGYWIGKMALISVLQAHDGRLAPTMLTGSVLEHLGAACVREIPLHVRLEPSTGEPADGRARLVPDSGHVVDPGRPGEGEGVPSVGGVIFRQESRLEPLRRHQMAGLCLPVVKAARQGDWRAREILQAAGGELGRLATAIIERLNMADDDFVVVPFGGVFKAGDLILRTFRETIIATAPKTSVIRPRFEPEVGAMLLALRAIGVTIDGEVIAALEESAACFPACRADAETTSAEVGRVWKDR